MSTTLTDSERISTWFGVVVGKRFRQRRRSLPELEAGAVAALAASDIWLICVEAADPVQAVGEFLTLEEAL